MIPPPASRRPFRPVTGIDLAASLVASVVPERLNPALEQVRRDVHAVVDGFLGQNELSYSTEQHPTRAPRPLSEIDAFEALLPRAVGPRYRALKRDVRVIVRGFQGKQPAPFFERRETASSRNPRSIATAQPSTTRLMRIASVTRETADAVTLRLEDVSGAKVSFEPGQFLSVRADVKGETLWRAYSICTTPASGEVAITIKRVEGGRVSNQLNEGAKLGDVLEVRGPSGRFTVQRATTPRHVVLLGGGSGITPLMSHAQSLLESEPLTRVTLLYGNRSERDIIFKTALAGLSHQYPGRFALRHVLSQKSETLTSGLGMLDQATTLRELTDLSIEDNAGTQFLICGPEPMMKAARAALLARGVAESSILEERFTGPVASDASSGQSYREQPVVVVVKGKETQVRVKPGLTLLEAALAANVPFDFSCTMGGCGACMAQLVEGSVHMDEPSCLSASERAQGKILTCVAHPTSPCRVEKI